MLSLRSQSEQRLPPIDRSNALSNSPRLSSIQCDQSLQGRVYSRLQANLDHERPHMNNLDDSRSLFNDTVRTFDQAASPQLFNKIKGSNSQVDKSWAEKPPRVPNRKDMLLDPQSLQARLPPLHGSQGSSKGTQVLPQSRDTSLNNQFGGLLSNTGDHVGGSQRGSSASFAVSLQ